jgi:hypothetical protein
MKKILITLGIVLPTLTFGAIFDFTNGEPTIVNDGTVADYFEQTKYDFANGQPTQVFDTTAVDTSPTGSNDGLIINNGGEIINNGGRIIQ